MKATLTDSIIIEEEGSTHDLVELARNNRGKISIGRSRENVIVIGGTTFVRSIYTNIVSRNHGTITVDPEKGTVYFTDDSKYGTAIERAGEDMMLVHKGETVRLQDRDNLYLGVENIPSEDRYGPLWVNIELEEISEELIAA